MKKSPFLSLSIFMLSAWYTNAQTQEIPCGFLPDQHYISLWKDPNSIPNMRLQFLMEFPLRDVYQIQSIEYNQGRFRLSKSPISQNNDGVEGDLQLVDKVVPIVAHIVRSNSGSNGLSNADLDDFISIANGFYNNFHLNLVVCGRIFIDSDAIFNNEFSCEDESVGNINASFNVLDVVTRNVAGHLNIYFVPYSNTSWTWSPNAHEDFQHIMMWNAQAMNGTTLSHEIGHWFDLLHTHDGGNELVNGSNCTTAGDLICDTPADPDLSSTVNANCVYIGTSVDANGEQYNPDTRNLLSYAGSCRNRFSDGQIYRMQAAFMGMEEDRGYIFHSTEPINLENGLIAYYPFNGAPNDESGNDQHATNMGATPTYDRVGNPNSAYEFDGLEDHMLLLDHDETVDFSISLWIKNLRGATEDFQWFLGTNNDNWSNPGFLIGHDRTINTRYEPDHWLAVVLDGTHQSIGYDLGKKEMGRWYHLVYSYDAETHLNQFYIDGALVESGIEQMGSNTNPISLGKQGITDFRHSNIVVDDVRIYNRILYCSEISEIFDQCYVNLESSLIAHYPFNGNDLDISGNDHHPTSNTATLTNDRFDNPMAAYLFDGIDDQIEIPNPFGEIVDDSHPVSISLWFKTSTTKAQADLFSYFTKCRSGDGNTDDDYFSLSILNGNSFFVSNGNSNAIIPAASIDDDNFHFLFLASSGNKMDLYLDNNLLQSVAMIPSDDPVPNYYNFVLGYLHSNNCGDNSRFEGVIDDVRLYGKSVNPCEQVLVNIECDDEIYLTDLTISATQSVSARSSITLENVTLGPTGELTLTAPTVNISPNNEVKTGGKLFVINQNICSRN